MELDLDLASHCIETEIRRLYNRAVSSALREPSRAGEFEPVIELARRCLEGLDFAALRSACKPLAGGTGSRIRLVDQGDRIVIVSGGREWVFDFSDAAS
jgi:hypothetical protein